LFMCFAFVAIPFIAWILSGGLRRKLSSRNHTSIIVIHPSPQRPPLQSGHDRGFAPPSDGEDSFPG
jgi:hypothetical protein